MPAYAAIERKYMPARETGARVGFLLMAIILGLALGAWRLDVGLDLRRIRQLSTGLPERRRLEFPEHRDRATDPDAGTSAQDAYFACGCGARLAGRQNMGQMNEPQSGF